MNSKRYEQMMEAKQKAYDLASSTTRIVMQANQFMKDEFAKINSNPDLSPEGKAKLRAEYNAKLADSFMKELRNTKADYEQAIAKAGVQAELLLSEKPAKPGDVPVTTFERELNDLRVKLMLSTNSDSSLKMLSEFAEKNYEYPYFTSQIADTFPELAASVLSSAGTDAAKVKLKLSPLFDSIKSSMLSDEQKQAQAIYENTREDFGRKLFFEGSLEASKVNEMFGPQVAHFINRPHDYQTAEEKQQQQEQQDTAQ